MKGGKLGHPKYYGKNEWHKKLVLMEKVRCHLTQGMAPGDLRVISKRFLEPRESFGTCKKVEDLYLYINDGALTSPLPH